MQESYRVVASCVSASVCGIVPLAGAHGVQPLVARRMSFTTDLVDGRLVLPEVVHSSRHVLRPFYLINLSDEPLAVHLQSDFSTDQLAFQLENANLGDGVTADDYNEV